MKQQILSLLPAGMQENIHWFDTIDSTNLEARRMAAAGAPHGTVILAGHQSAGRGRMGRQFDSPAGQGVYLSMLLRPQCPPDKLMHLTCTVGVAMCDGVKAASGLRPDLKWINDLVVGQKKLGGILVELSTDPGTGLVDFAILGIGINCTQSREDFPEELRNIATSLSLCGHAVHLSELAAAMIRALRERDLLIPDMDRYRQLCITPGKEVLVVRGDRRYRAHAHSVDDTGSLVIRLADGSMEAVSSGEVSVRGMYGYCDL